MKQSQLFTKTKKQAPSDEVSKNAQLLIKAGFIHKEMAGVYAYLPLGLRVMNKIMNVIREEMHRAGGQEMLLTALQESEIWKKTERWSDDVIDVWFKTSLASGSEVGLATTHEEPLTNLMRQHIHSYKDLPAYPFQFQTKFRNELRAKSGLMRSREFIMKDLYSFSRDQEAHNTFYERMKDAYVTIFDRVGIGEVTYVTFASGGSFSKYSHEFQTITEAGEDTVYVDESKNIAINKEVFNDEVLEQLELNKDTLVEKKAIEVGNIFTLGTRFSDALGLKYVDESGAEQPVFMGSYGIGPGRLMGTIVEINSDDRGIIWPKTVAPFAVHLMSLSSKDESLNERIQNVADDTYKELLEQGVEVLWDDRAASPGEKFADADLIGIPLRIVVSEKTLKEGALEWKERHATDMMLVPVEEIVERITTFVNEPAAK